MLIIESNALEAFILSLVYFRGKSIVVPTSNLPMHTNETYNYSDVIIGYFFSETIHAPCNLLRPLSDVYDILAAFLHVCMCKLYYKRLFPLKRPYGVGNVPTAKSIINVTHTSCTIYDRQKFGRAAKSRNGYLSRTIAVKFESRNSCSYARYTGRRRRG